MMILRRTSSEECWIKIMETYGFQTSLACGIFTWGLSNEHLHKKIQEVYKVDVSQPA